MVIYLVKGLFLVVEITGFSKKTAESDSHKKILEIKGNNQLWKNANFIS